MKGFWAVEIEVDNDKLSPPVTQIHTRACLNGMSIRHNARVCSYMYTTFRVPLLKTVVMSAMSKLSMTMMAKT